MKLTYSSLKDEDVLILTDFTCGPSRELLSEKGLYKILWSKQKKVDIQIDGYKMALKKNEVIFCTPLNVLDLLAEPEGLIAFVFNKEFFCIQTHDDQVSCHGFLFFGSSHPPVIELCPKDLARFNGIQTLFEEDFEIKDHLRGEMLRSLLKRLLIMSTRMIKNDLPQPSISNAHIDIIREYNILVEKHFREYHQVKDYANLLFKSPKTLSNIFLKYGDKSPLAFINDRIVLEARRLLLYSKKSTEEIANELGYKDSSHFSKFFKRHQKVSPSELRKQHSVSA